MQEVFVYTADTSFFSASKSWWRTLTLGSRARNPCPRRLLVTDRRRRILALAGSLYDLLPAPKGSLSGARPGLAPGQRRPCVDCRETGWVTDRFKRRRPCLTCGGRPAGDGVKARRGRGFVMVDAMDSQQEVIRTEARDLPTRPARMVGCDACAGSGVGAPHLDEHGREYRDPCERCNGAGKRSVTVFDLQVDRDRGDQETLLEQALERRSQTGDWRALEDALAGLTRQVNKPHPFRLLNGEHAAITARRLFETVWVTRLRAYESLDVQERELIELAYEFVSWRMPDPVRVPAAIVRADRDREARLALAFGRGAGKQALARRDGEIRKLARQGRPTQWIAQQYGLSVRQINAIVAGKSEAA